jgi:hypothetical protein
MRKQEGRTRRAGAARGWPGLVAAGFCAVLALPVGGAFLPFAATPALADDDDDDDDGGGIRFSRPRYERPQPRARAQRPARREARPEFVAMLAPGQPTEPLVAAGFEVLARSPLPAIGNDVVRLRSERRESLDAALQRLRGLLPNTAVDRNDLYRPSALPCSPAGCPPFAMVGWPGPPRACAVETTIGMIDTAVAAGHPAFRIGAVETVTIRGPERRPSSEAHGTAIAALLVGQSDGANPGLLPRAKLVAVDVFHRAGSGDASDTFDLVRGVDALLGRDIKLINLSLAGADNPVLRAAIEAAVGRGAILVAAAGNQGPRAAPVFPAAYNGVIAVTAIDKDGKLYRQANRGDYVDFAAPGVDLGTATAARGRSTRRGQSGTSYAAPFVTAALAVALAREGAEATTVEAGLRTSAKDLGEPGRDREFGWGLVSLPQGCP